MNLDFPLCEWVYEYLHRAFADCLLSCFRHTPFCAFLLCRLGITYLCTPKTQIKEGAQQITADIY